MQKQTDKAHDYNLDVSDIEPLVCHVAMLWRRLVGLRIKNLKVSITERRVLYCIMRHPGLTQVQIAKKLDLEPQNLLRILDKLEKNKWITKCIDPKDRRIKCLKITPESKKIISQIDKITAEVKKEVLEDVDLKKIQTTVDNLGSIRKNLLELLDRE